MSTGVLLLEVRVLLFVKRGRISISSGAGSNPSAKKRHDHSCVSCVARLLGGARRAPCRVVGRVLCTYPISSVARGNVLVHVSCTAHTTQRVTQTDQCSVTRPRTATGRCSLSIFKTRKVFLLLYVFNTLSCVAVRPGRGPPARRGGPAGGAHIPPRIGPNPTPIPRSDGIPDCYYLFSFRVFHTPRDSVVSFSSHNQSHSCRHNYQ